MKSKDQYITDATDLRLSYCTLSLRYGYYTSEFFYLPTELWLLYG
jgi:hypothetical protein